MFYCDMSIRFSYETYSLWMTLCPSTHIGYLFGSQFHYCVSVTHTSIHICANNGPLLSACKETHSPTLPIKICWAMVILKFKWMLIMSRKFWTSRIYCSNFKENHQLMSSKNLWCTILKGETIENPIMVVPLSTMFLYYGRVVCLTL